MRLTAVQGTPVMIGGGVLAYTLLGVCLNPSPSTLSTAVQGTPVMIGGGVLRTRCWACASTRPRGRCAFLILDPHFTGADSLERVRAGGWVAWKRADGRAAGAGGELFVRGAFYNLLCPQRPRCI